MCHSNKYLQKDESNQLQMCHSNKYLQKYEPNQLQMCHSNKHLQKYQLINQLNQLNQLIHELNTLKYANKYPNIGQKYPKTEIQKKNPLGVGQFPIGPHCESETTTAIVPSAPACHHAYT